jgi:hypothetical protein
MARASASENPSPIWLSTVSRVSSAYMLGMEQLSMGNSVLQRQLKHFSDNQSGPRFILIYGNRLNGQYFSIIRFYSWPSAFAGWVNLLQ